MAPALATSSFVLCLNSQLAFFPFFPPSFLLQVNQSTHSCPTESHLSRSWQCTVSLRFVTDNEGQSLSQARNEVFGSTIYDIAEVKGRIRRAQRAILSLKKVRKAFLEEEADGEEEGEEWSFSCFVADEWAGCFGFNVLQFTWWASFFFLFE